MEESICCLEECQLLIERANGPIKTGPSLLQLEMYCEVLSDIRKASLQLSLRSLDHCKLIKDSLDALEREAVDKLGQLFTHTLEQSSVPMDLMLAKQTGTKAELPDEVIIRSLNVMASCLSSTEKASRLFVDVRGKYLAVCLQPLLTRSVNEQTGYQRGSHPVIIGLKCLSEEMLPVERELCLKVLPMNESLFSLCMKPVATLLNGHLISLAKEASVQCSEHCRFLDYIYLLDILEQLYRINQSSPDLRAFSASFKSLFEACRAWFDKLKKTVQSGSFPLPENATVYEGTSLTFNCLKKLAEYDGISEAVLSVNDDTVSCDSRFLQPDSVLSISFYIKDLMALSEESFVKCSKLYSRALKTDIFLLNNYNYMSKTVKLNSKLAALIPVDVEERFDGNSKRIVDVLVDSWNRLAAILVDNNPKDGYKMFCGDLMELINVGGQIAVPDGDQRQALRASLQRAILPVLQAFYNQYFTFVTLEIREL